MEKVAKFQFWCQNFNEKKRHFFAVLHLVRDQAPNFSWPFRCAMRPSVCNVRNAACLVHLMASNGLTCLFFPIWILVTVQFSGPQNINVDVKRLYVFNNSARIKFEGIYVQCVIDKITRWIILWWALLCFLFNRVLGAEAEAVSCSSRFQIGGWDSY